MLAMHHRRRARIGVVEDDPVLAPAIASMVEAAGYELVGVATTVAEGRALVHRGVDLLLLDLGLPDGSGHELIHTDGARYKVVVLSLFADAPNVVRAIELGANGYLLKDAGVEQVASAIGMVLEGGAPISPSVAGHLLARLRRPREQPRERRPSLTTREVALLEGLAKGLSYKELAEVFGVSYYTISDHAKAVYRKLAVGSRAEAVFEALQTGIISVRD
ncbi:MAG: response regulator transcription factor [Labilithrix sp.]